MGAKLSRLVSKTKRTATKVKSVAAKLPKPVPGLVKRTKCTSYFYRLPLDVRYKIFDLIEGDDVERSLALLDLRPHPLLHVNRQLRTEYLYFSFKMTVFHIRLQFFHDPIGPRFVPDQGRGNYIQPQYAPTNTVRKTHWIETLSHGLPIRHLHFILLGCGDYPWIGVLEVEYTESKKWQVGSKIVGMYASEDASSRIDVATKWLRARLNWLSREDDAADPSWSTIMHLIAVISASQDDGCFVLCD